MKLFCIIILYSLTELPGSFLNYLNPWAQKSTQSQDSTTLQPSSTPLTRTSSLNDSDEYYVIERDGSIRSTSPDLTKEGKGGIPPTELNLVDGKLVYLENDETALVFDGMEVREYHFSELQAPQKTEGVASTKVEKETSNTKKSEGVVELEEIDDDAVSIGSRGGTDPTSTTTTSAAISEKHEPKSPERSLTSLKPETEEFLHRLRAMQFIGAGCFGGSLGVMPISSLKYAWKPQVKVPSSRPAGEMEDYDDLYYIPAEDRNTVMVQSPHGVLRKPKQQGPHLFYIKQGNCPVSSSTTRPN